MTRTVNRGSTSAAAAQNELRATIDRCMSIRQPEDNYREWQLFSVFADSPSRYNSVCVMLQTSPPDEVRAYLNHLARGV